MSIYETQKSMMGAEVPSDPKELVKWARSWTHQMGVPIRLLHALADEIERKGK